MDTNLALSQDSIEATTKPTSPSEGETLNTNYQEIIKQQQAQIEQLIKQQELNKQVNEQLTESLKNAQKTILEGNEKKDNRHWIDKNLEDNFKFERSFSLEDLGDNSAVGPTSQVALWYLQYLKDQGASNEEAANRLKNVFENKDFQEHPKTFR